MIWEMISLGLVAVIFLLAYLRTQDQKKISGLAEKKEDLLKAEGHLVSLLKQMHQDEITRLIAMQTRESDTLRAYANQLAALLENANTRLMSLAERPFPAPTPAVTHPAPPDEVPAFPVEEARRVAAEVAGKNGVSEESIEAVMEEVNCPREDAIKILSGEISHIDKGTMIDRMVLQDKRRKTGVT